MELENISHDQLCHGYLLLHTVANDVSSWRGEHPETIERSLAAELLHDADRRVDNQHQPKERVLDRADDQDRHHRPAGDGRNRVHLAASPTSLDLIGSQPRRPRLLAIRCARGRRQRPRRHPVLRLGVSSRSTTTRLRRSSSPARCRLRTAYRLYRIRRSPTTSSSLGPPGSSASIMPSSARARCDTSACSRRATTTASSPPM